MVLREAAGEFSVDMTHRWGMGVIVVKKHFSS
jgi:hypothetical protein